MLFHFHWGVGGGWGVVLFGAGKSPCECQHQLQMMKTLEKIGVAIPASLTRRKMDDACILEWRVRRTGNFKTIGFIQKNVCRKLLQTNCVTFNIQRCFYFDGVIIGKSRCNEDVSLSESESSEFLPEREREFSDKSQKLVEAKSPQLIGFPRRGFRSV